MLRTTVSTERSSDQDLEFMAHVSTGRLTTEDGPFVGSCKFSTYRKKRNGAPMDADHIVSEIYLFNGSAHEMCEALNVLDPHELQYYFNASYLLVADRIEIDKEFRGDGTWRQLYFDTMAAACSSQKAPVPDQFFFKVFPLCFESNVSSENAEAFNNAQRELKLFYSIYIGAKALDLPTEFGCFMRAPVPPRFLRARDNVG